MRLVKIHCQMIAHLRNLPLWIREAHAVGRSFLVLCEWACSYANEWTTRDGEIIWL